MIKKENPKDDLLRLADIIESKTFWRSKNNRRLPEKKRDGSKDAMLARLGLGKESLSHNSTGPNHFHESGRGKHSH